MEAIQSALADFGRKMSASNRTFWTAKVHALEQDSSLTDRQRLDILAAYYFLSSWGTSGYGSTVTSPAQILLRPGDPGYLDMHVDSNGISPPKPADLRTRYVTKLSAMVNEVYAASPSRDADGPATIDVPEEFRHFLVLTDGVSDFDYHRVGSCGLYGGFLTDWPNRFDMSDYSPNHRTWRDAGYVVASGWQAAIGDLASTQVLFCRNKDGTEDERAWGWRVFYCDSLEPDGRWFKDIAGFLAFKADWLNRLPEGWETMRVGRSEEEEWDEGEEEDEEDED